MDTDTKIIDKIMKYNHSFVRKKRYEIYTTDKYPKKNLAILTCMDTRLTELLPAALGIGNGDAKIIRNAGAIISHPYGSEVKSLLVAILELGVTNIMIIAHTDCGVEKMDSTGLIDKMLESKVRREAIDSVISQGVDMDNWLGGFQSAKASVRNAVLLLKHHPLIPEGVGIFGFVMDTRTGELSSVE